MLADCASVMSTLQDACSFLSLALTLSLLLTDCHLLLQVIQNFSRTFVTYSLKGRQSKQVGWRVTSITRIALQQVCLFLSHSLVCLSIFIYLFYIPRLILHPLLLVPVPYLPPFPHPHPFLLSFYSEKGRPLTDADKMWHIKLQ